MNKDTGAWVLYGYFGMGLFIGALKIPAWAEIIMCVVACASANKIFPVLFITYLNEGLKTGLIKIVRHEIITQDEGKTKHP